MKRKATTPTPQASAEIYNKGFKSAQKRSISPNSVASQQSKRNFYTGGRSMQTATAAPSSRTSIISSKNIQKQVCRDKIRDKGFSQKNSIGSNNSQSPIQPPYFGNN